MEHDALRAFVVKRAGSPDVGEQVKGLRSLGYLALHVNRGRGVTYWDAAENVCWLLAYSATHATGEDRDAYKAFERLDTRDELLPTADDYEALYEVTDANLIDGFAEYGVRLYDEARLHPGREVNASFEANQALLVVDLIVIDGKECEEGWISIIFDRETPLTADVALDIVAKLLPQTIDLSTLEMTATFNGRSARDDELIWTWSLLPSEDAS